MPRSSAFLSVAAACAAAIAVAAPGAGAASSNWCAKAAKSSHSTVAFKDGSVSLLRQGTAYSLCSDTKHRVVSAALNDGNKVTQFIAFPGKCAFAVTKPPKNTVPQVGAVDLHAAFAANATSVSSDLEPLGFGASKITIEKVVASSSCFVAASESLVQTDGTKLRQIQMFGIASNPDTAIQSIPCSVGTSDADLRHLKISGRTASWVEAGKKVTHAYGASTG